MSKRRVVVGVVVLVIAVIVLWRWRNHDDAKTTTDTNAPVLVRPPAGDAPRWVGQAGVGGRRIAGLVLDEAGAPIGGASVRLASVATTAGLGKESLLATDDSGRFDFGARAGAEYVIVADAAHLTSVIDDLDLRDPLLVPPPDQLRLVLHACTTSIHGTIHDNAGGVVAGARISRDRVTTTGGAESDAAGSYELCLPAGGARVRVTSDGYAALADTVNVFGRTRRDFDLAPGAIVGGRVIRAIDKAPVEGAIIEIQPEDWQSGGASVIASSDAEGRFHADGVTPGRLRVSARADRLETAVPAEALVEIGHPSEDLVVELAAAMTVSGKVVLRGGSTPVVGFTVFLVGHGTPVSAITQSDGTFAIERVLPGEYQPLIRPMSRRSMTEAPLAKVKVETKDVTGLVLAMEPTSSISGTIMHAGKPVDGATVQVEGTPATTESNQDGSYTLRGLDAGEHVVYAESHRVGAFARSAPVTLGQGEERTGVNVELTLSGSIAGVVVDEAGVPVPGVFLSFSLLHGRDFGSATTADDGSFTARALAGGGDYIYEVRQRDRSPLIFAPAEGKRFPPVTVADGGTHLTGLRVRIKVERMTISGKITDAANKPAADVVVHAEQFDGAYGYAAGTAATSDQSGAFTIRDLMPGAYRLQAIGARGEAQVEKVPAGQRDVAIRLVELGGIDGTLEGFTATEVTAMNDRGNGSRAGITGGAFSFRNLPAGDYRIVAGTPRAPEYESVTVTPGEIVKVTLLHRETGTIEGTIIDSKTRAPVARMWCMSALDDTTRRGAQSGGAMSDARGAFRLQRAPVGANTVICGGRSTAVTVVASGQVTRVEITTEENGAGNARSADSGIELEQQLGEVVVDAVKPGSAAARAGVERGDVLVKVNDVAVKRFGVYASQVLDDLPPSTPIKLSLERADKPLVVTITLDPAD